MVIGLTYDLRDEYLQMGYGEEETGEFDRLDTIESIENALHGLGYATDRIGHIKNLVNRLSKGDRWDLVFNIAEGMYGSGRKTHRYLLCWMHTRYRMFFQDRWSWL